METIVHHHSLRTWMIAGAIASGTLLALVLVRWIAVVRLAKITEKTTNLFDDILLETIRQTKILFILIAAIYAGSIALRDLPALERTIVQKVSIIALFIQGAVWGSAAIRFGVKRHRERSLDTDAGSVTTMAAFGLLGRIAIWVFLLLAILQNFGVEISALITGLGIGGIAVALAVQNILGDVLGSLSIVLDKPFVIGDFLIVDNMMGTVEHVGLKTTRIRSLSGEQLIFANNDLLKSRIRNYKQMRERRIVFNIGVTYDTPAGKLELVPKIVKEVVEAESEARFQRCHFFQYGDSALIFETVYLVAVPDYDVYMDIQQRINLALFRRFASEQIEFAFPTRTLYVHQVSAA